MKAILGSIPQSIGFAISGGLGNVIFFYLDKLVYQSNPYDWQKVSVSWAISYLISVWFQHLLHQALVFGMSSNYWSSLFVTYATYSLSIVISPFLSSFFSYMGISHSMCWFLTVGSTGVLNYFLVSKAMDTEKDESTKQEMKDK
mmetsp:Transcript_33457/g.42123  ORF Transcript_33457/g.42123 Transcript_33457/m.42123 type:complete len:144 (-) Transcript_33457:196-627(-)